MKQTKGTKTTVQKESRSNVVNQTEKTKRSRKKKNTDNNTILPEKLYSGMSESRVTVVKNVYKGISTEEKIRLYLRICRYAMDGEEL